MPVPSNISLLPEEVRNELNIRLKGNGFSDYEVLASWLQEEGFEISRSAVGRYGKDFKDQVKALKESTEMAKFLVNEVGDDDGAMNDALLRTLQHKLFGLLRTLNADPKKVNINSITRAVADLSRAAVAQKKWMAEAGIKSGLFLEFFRDMVSYLTKEDPEAVPFVERNFDDFIAFAKAKYGA